MLDFIRQHWKAYLIALAIAIAAGAGAAAWIGVKASTPDKVRLERISAEQQNTDFIDEVRSSSGSASVTAPAQ